MSEFGSFFEIVKNYMGNAKYLAHITVKQSKEIKYSVEDIIDRYQLRHWSVDNRTPCIEDVSLVYGTTTFTIAVFDQIFFSIN